MIRPVAEYAFEISWEVCNKAGGINTVIKTKAPYMRGYYQNYFLIGPYFKQNADVEFIEEEPPTFLKGIFDGEWKVYHPNGKLKQTGVYTNGLEEGFWKYYHPNGNTYMEGKYIQGKQEANWKVFYEDGKPLADYFYQSGKLHGKQTAYDKEGKAVEEKVYENGVQK